jgi:hypothetical protein
MSRDTRGPHRRRGPSIEICTAPRRKPDGYWARGTALHDRCVHCTRPGARPRKLPPIDWTAPGQSLTSWRLGSERQGDSLSGAGLVCLSAGIGVEQASTRHLSPTRLASGLWACEVRTASWLRGYATQLYYTTGEAARKGKTGQGHSTGARQAGRQAGRQAAHPPRLNLVVDR